MKDRLEIFTKQGILTVPGEVIGDVDLGGLDTHTGTGMDGHVFQNVSHRPPGFIFKVDDEAKLSQIHGLVDIEAELHTAAGKRYQVEGWISGQNGGNPLRIEGTQIIPM